MASSRVNWRDTLFASLGKRPTVVSKLNFTGVATHFPPWETIELSHADTQVFHGTTHATFNDAPDGQIQTKGHLPLIDEEEGRPTF
jgi:hypothetical protein